MWTGWIKTSSLGLFKHVNAPFNKVNESVLSIYHTWHAGEPNGGKKEDCVLMYINGEIFDVPCKNMGACGICHVSTLPVFKIRGLCEETKFDTQFSVMALGLTEGQSQKIPFFVGFHNSLISLDDTQTYWMLENTKDRSAYATVNVTKSNSIGMYGTQIWHFFNDTCTESGEMLSPMLYKKEISFNLCNDEMFNCRDGTW